MVFPIRMNNLQMPEIVRILVIQPAKNDTVTINANDVWKGRLAGIK